MRGPSSFPSTARLNFLKALPLAFCRASLVKTFQKTVREPAEAWVPDGDFPAEILPKSASPKSLLAGTYSNLLRRQDCYRVWLAIARQLSFERRHGKLPSAVLSLHPNLV